MSGVFGGGAAKTDRKEQLTSFQDLHNVFNFALPSAQSAFATGQQATGTALDYFKKILSGNRTAVTQAVAPEANAVRSGADASKRQLATSGTARGGGTNAVSQQVDDKSRATVDNAILGARGDAAKETAKIGGSELASAAQILGIGEGSANDLGNLALGSKKQSDANNAAAGQAAGQLAMAALMFA